MSFHVLKPDQCKSLANVLVDGLYQSGVMDDGNEIVFSRLEDVDKGIVTIEEVRQWAKDIKEAIVFCQTWHDDFRGVNEDFIIDEVEEQWAERHR